MTTPKETPMLELDNGLRIHLRQVTGPRRAAVCLAIGSGMVSDGPGRDGVMHLLEHMVYQDSRGATQYERSVDIDRYGGRTGGHTHMQYTEFFETGPTHRLGAMVSRILDQVLQPLLRPQDVTKQIQAVTLEGDQRLAPAPGQVLPWPHLSGLHWTDHAHAHNGMGDLGLRSRITLDQLQALHRRHYRLDRMVLSIATPDPAGPTWEILERALQPWSCHRPDPSAGAGPAPAPSRAGIVAQGRHAQVPGHSRRWMAVTDNRPTAPGATGAAAQSVLAELLTTVPGVSASNGLFGPADLVGEDLFVVIDDRDHTPHRPQELLDRAQDQDLELARHRAQARYEASLIDVERLARTTARDLLLRGSPDHVAGLVRAVARVGPGDVRREAAALARRPWSTITVHEAHEGVPAA